MAGNVKNKDPHFEKTVGIGNLSIYDGHRRISYVESSVHTSSTGAPGNERKHGFWWKYRAERDREPFIYNAKCIDCLQCTAHSNGIYLDISVPKSAAGTGTSIRIFTMTSLGSPSVNQIHVKIQGDTASTLNKIVDAINGVVDASNIKYGSGITTGGATNKPSSGVSALTASSGASAASKTIKALAGGSEANNISISGHSNLVAGSAAFVGGGGHRGVTQNRAQIQHNQIRALQREHSRPVKDSYEIHQTYRPGANTKRRQNVNYIYGKYEEEKTVDGDIADGISVEFYTQSVDDDYALPFKAVDDGLDQITLDYVVPKRKMPMRCYDGNTLGESEREYYGQERLPFTVFSSSITASNDLTGLAYNISLENMHLDSYGEIPLQGPWTEESVGGYQYRHGQLLVTGSNERSEGYRIIVDAANNSITVNNPRIIQGDYDLDKPIGKYTRGEYAKRSVNIRNIRTVSASANQYHSIGNYSSSYEIVQTSGRDINNRFITREGEISVTETTSSFISWSAGAPVVDYTLSDRAGADAINDHVIVERFSAPGGILESSTAYLDIEAGQYSPYNALPWRNYNTRRSLDTLYIRHSLSGGYDSNTPTSASYHKTPRNALRQANKFFAAPDAIDVVSTSASFSYDNWFVNRQIPRTELQYKWVRDASVYTFDSGGEVSSDLETITNLTSSMYNPFFGFDYHDFYNASRERAATDETLLEGIPFVSQSEGMLVTAYNEGQEQETILDFVGMNAVIVGDIQILEFDENTMLAEPNTLLQRNSTYVHPNIFNNLTNPSEADAALPFVYQNYNGPYGYPSWKQLRAGWHPVAKALRRNNIYENLHSSLDVNNQETTRRYRIKQTAITTKHSPVEFNLIKDEKEFSIDMPFGNEQHFFTKESYEEGYWLIGPGSAELVSLNRMSDYNDEFNIIPNYDNSKFVKMADQPWTLVNYSETVYPRDENVGKSATVNRDYYRRTRDYYLEYGSPWPRSEGGINIQESFWSDDQSDRISYRINSQGDTILASSWPMEVVTASTPSAETSGELMRFDTCFLANTYGADGGACPVAPTGSEVNAKFGRFYGHCRPQSEVTVNYFPDGDGGSTGGYPPFPESYAKWAADLATRAKTQGYSVLPEFRISEYIRNIDNDDNPDYRNGEVYSLRVDGVYNNNQVGSNVLHLETYSHSDKINNLDAFREYYDEPSAIELTMDVLVKFRPRKEFYPVYRTLDLAEQFSQSYGSEASLTGSQKSWRTVLAPFYAPGIMYNSIKAGIAVDYPFVDMAQNRSATAPTGGCHDVYENRMPFEAILEPAHYSQQVKRNQFNPIYQATTVFDWDPENPIDSTGSIGATDGVYEKMAHNFFAETIDFFTQNVTTIKSKPLSQWQEKMAGEKLWTGGDNNMSLEQVANGETDLTDTSYIKKYAMDVFIKKKGAWAQSTAAHWFGAYPYVHHVPPYWASSPTNLLDPDDADKSAFLGSGWATVCVEGQKCCTGASLNPTMSMGENESYMRIVFDPTGIAVAEPERFLKGAFTVSDIANNSEFTFVNVGMENALGSTPAGAMPLSSSINIFGLDSDDRWTIAPKWESLIRNYAYEGGNGLISSIDDYNSPFPSIWQQQGKNFTKKTEGLFLEVKSSDLSNNITTGSLVDMAGFELGEKRIGEAKAKKVLQEAIVAIPFYTDKQGVEQFLNIPIEQFEEAYSIVKKGEAADQSLNSIVDLINKMRKYVMIPQFDFVKTRDESTEPLVTAYDYFVRKTMQPFAMYIFETTVLANKTDLQQYWENNFNKGENSQDALLTKIKINHPIKDGEMISPEMLRLAGLEGKLPSDLRFKIFKIKYRAQTNYYETYERYTGVPAKYHYEAPKFSYNWPYDYFSLVEMGKLEVTLQTENKDITNVTEE